MKRNVHLSQQQNHGRLGNRVVKVIEATGVVSRLQTIDGQVYKFLGIPLEQRPDCECLCERVKWIYLRDTLTSVYDLVDAIHNAISNKVLQVTKKLPLSEGHDRLEVHNLHAM